MFSESSTTNETETMLRPNQASRLSDRFCGILFQSAVSGFLCALRAYLRLTQGGPEIIEFL
jgi:hypothetical protein